MMTLSNSLSTVFLAVLRPAIPLANMTSAFLVCLAFLCFLVSLQPFNRWIYRHIPGPVALPFVGNLLDIAKGGTDYIVECHRRYGPVFKLWIGVIPLVFVANPESARKLQTRFNDRETSPPIARSKDEYNLQFSGVVAANGEMWRIAHRAWQPVFRSDCLAAYLELMDRCATKLVGRLHQAVEANGSSPGPVMDICQEVGLMTMAVISSTAFGIDFDTSNKEDSDVGKEVLGASAAFFKSTASSPANLYNLLELLFPWARPAIASVANAWPGRTLLEYRTAVDRLRKVAVIFMDRQLLGNEQCKPNGSFVTLTDGTVLRDGGPALTSPPGTHDQQTPASSTNPNFINTITRSNNLTRFQILSQITTLLLAGYDTTAKTITMAVYNLSKNPAAEARLLQEVDALGKRGGALTPGDMECLPYTEAVIKETLRLCGPVPLTSRKTNQELEVCGKVIPRGSIVAIPFCAIHHDPEVWPQPEEFQPERFLPGGHAAGELPRGYMPFGAGARMCIGHKFAMQEAKVALVRLYQHYVFRLEGTSTAAPLKFPMGVTLMPVGGVPFHVVRRE